MVDAEKPKSRKKDITVALVKLIMAITALVTAINGYLELEKQNALVLQALGSKVNELAKEVSYLHGRVDASAPLPAVHAMPVPPAAVDTGEEDLELAGIAEVMAESAPEEPQLKLRAYEYVPLDMEALQQMSADRIGGKD